MKVLEMSKKGSTEEKILIFLEEYFCAESVRMEISLLLDEGKILKVNYAVMHIAYAPILKT